jgi:hypothetical protein
VVCKAIKDSGEARDGYDEIEFYLHEICLLVSSIDELSLQLSNSGVQVPNHLHIISTECTKVKDLMKTFTGKLQRYANPNLFRKVKWSLQFSQEVAQFRAVLCSHVNLLQLGLNNLHM